jgi:phage gpG-like protein
MLKWQTPDGQWHQAQSVTIPARPFMGPALIEGKDPVLKNIQEFVSEVIR